MCRDVYITALNLPFPRTKDSKVPIYASSVFSILMGSGGGGGGEKERERERERDSSTEMMHTIPEDTLASTKSRWQNQIRVLGKENRTDLRGITYLVFTSSPSGSAPSSCWETFYPLLLRGREKMQRQDRQRERQRGFLWGVTFCRKKGGKDRMDLIHGV